MLLAHITLFFQYWRPRFRSEQSECGGYQTLQGRREISPFSLFQCPFGLIYAWHQEPPQKPRGLRWLLVEPSQHPRLCGVPPRTRRRQRRGVPTRGRGWGGWMQLPPPAAAPHVSPAKPTQQLPACLRLSIAVSLYSRGL